VLPSAHQSLDLSTFSAHIAVNARHARNHTLLIRVLCNQRFAAVRTCGCGGAAGELTATVRVSFNIIRRPLRNTLRRLLDLTIACFATQCQERSRPCEILQSKVASCQPHSPEAWHHALPPTLSTPAMPNAILMTAKSCSSIKQEKW